MLYVERARLIKESSLGQLSAIDDNLELSAEEKMRLKLEAETAAASAAVKEWVRLMSPWFMLNEPIILFGVLI